MRPGGAHATNAAAYALGRELRRVRVATGITPKRLSGITGIGRNKLDALELGELGDPRSRKRAGHLSRREALGLLLSRELRLSTEEADALLLLAYEAGAMSPMEVYEPLTPMEARSHGREPPSRDIDRRALISESVRSLLDANPFPGIDHQAQRAVASSVWELPSPRCSLFVGRSEELRLLREALVSDAPGVIAVSGPGGSGKSELARAAIDCEPVRQRFDACVWVTVRQHEFLGHSSRSDGHAPADPIAEIAAHLGVQPKDLPYVLERQRILVVIDNAETLTNEGDVISRLGRMAGKSKVLVTSRSRSSASFVLAFPAAAPLQGLSPSDAAELLAHEIGVRARGTQLDRSTLKGIARATGGAPLALHWVAGRAAMEPLDELVRAIEGDATAELYDFMFGRAWEELGTDAQQLMRLLAYESVEPVPRQLLAAMGRPRRSDEAVNTLWSASLVESDGTNTVGLHPLARAFVRASRRPLARREDRALHALDYLIRGLADDSRGSGAALPLGGLRNYLRWMAIATQRDPVLVMTAWTKLSRYLWEHWHWYLYEECGQIGAEAARQIGRTNQAAGTLLLALTELDLTYLRFEQGRPEEAASIGRRMRATFAALGDDAGLALADRYLGLVHMELGDERSIASAGRSWLDALRAIRRAKTHGYPRRGTRAGTAISQLRRLGLLDIIRGGYATYRGAWAPSEAQLHSLVGVYERRRGNVGRAAETLEKAIELYEKADGRWPGSEAAPMISLGECYVELGRPVEARRLYERALEIAQANDRRDLQGAVLLDLARSDLREAPDLAAAHAEAARAIFEQLGQARSVAEASELVSRASAQS